jgi:transposase-like protein
MATASKATGFGVRCPWCDDDDAVIAIDLNDFERCTCSSCDREFSPRNARAHTAELLARWEAVCRWVELAELAMDPKS